MTASEREEMPDGFMHLKTAGPWDELTLPQALRHSHQVGKSVWAMLKVIEGEVKFRMETSPLFETPLVAGSQ